MENNWLKERLTKAKQNSKLWGAFVDALQDVWNDNIGPILIRISNRKSFFTMDSEDMNTRISEYGRFFIIEESDKSRRPMLLTQRLDEVHFKGTYRPIEQTFWREFGEMPISWEPLYAPVNLDSYPYGTVLLTSEQLDGVSSEYGEFFLTSRGRVVLNMNQLEENNSSVTDVVINTMQERFLNIAAPLLPLHIVFDGLTLQLIIKLLDSEKNVLIYTGDTVAEKNIFFYQAEEVLKATFVNGDATTESAVFSSRTRSLETIPIYLDSMPLDAWPMDATVIIPAIIPPLNEDDPRITEKDDGSLSILTLDQKGCRVEYANDTVKYYTFPNGAKTATLLSSAGNWREDISMITYILGYMDTSRTGNYDGTSLYDGSTLYSGS